MSEHRSGSQTTRKQEDYSWINWAIYDKFLEDTIVCRCGEWFRSHSMFVGATGEYNKAAKGHVVTRKACPRCGRDNHSVEVKTSTLLWVVPMP
ncbi:MAG TPA: hypothetical protein VF747_10220 [Blastocatellia bacterium]|jgi:hypothetical protein